MMGAASRVAVVFGTGPAIGRACVESLGAAGAHVVCIDLDLAAATAAAKSVPHGTPVQADALDRASVRRAVEEIVSTWGGIDVLVNVVGGSRWSLSAETEDAEWDAVMALNLRQQWVVAQEVLQVMNAQERSGSIVAVASVSGLNAATRHGGYGAAKAGLINLVRTLAVENAPQVRVNAVAPGTIDTPARAKDEDLASRIPMRRRGLPHDIGEAVAFLASDSAAYITGQVLVVDGGATAKHALIDL